MKQRQQPEALPAEAAAADWIVLSFKQLLAQRDALLEALKKLEYSSDGAIKRFPEEAEVNAAIKAAEEGK